MALIFPLQGVDVVFLLTANIIEFVLTGVDDTLSVLCGSYEFILRRASEGHVHNEVGYNAHFHLGVIYGSAIFRFALHVPHSWGFRIRFLRVKPLKPRERLTVLQGTGGSCDGDYHNRVAIKVSSRKAFGNSSINSNGVLWVLGHHPNPFCLFVVDFQNRNLISPLMRKTNESHSFAIFEIRSVDLVIFGSSQRQYNLVHLPRKRGGFECHGGGVAVIGKRLQKNPSDGRI